MDSGLNKAFEKLTEALQFTRDKNVASIRACINTDKNGYKKEVAQITFKDGWKMYADIGGDANTTAMYDVLATLCELKKPSKGIYRVEPIIEKPDIVNVTVYAVQPGAMDLNFPNTEGGL